MRVLVCGGRYYGEVSLGASRRNWREDSDRAAREFGVLYKTLDDLFEKTGPFMLINGGARGADRLSRQWAHDRYNRCEVVTVAADWERFGNAAGPKRNGEMLKLNPDLVLAFLGGKGTADMIRQAKAAGVEVREVAP